MVVDCLVRSTKLDLDSLFVFSIGTIFLGSSSYIEDLLFILLMIDSRLLLLIISASSLIDGL